MDYVLYLDDTSCNPRSKFVTENGERVSIVGCLIPFEKYFQVLNEISNQLKMLDLYYNADEFHFCDIYNRRGDFVNNEEEDTISMIEVFSDIVRGFDIKLITATIKISDLENNPEFIEETYSIAKQNGFYLKGNHLEEACAFFQNIFNAKKYLDRLGNGDKIRRVYCDEGLKKAGTQFYINNLYPYPLQVSFNRSDSSPMLQLADFAAWSLTRMKHSVDKKNNCAAINPFERKVVNILRRCLKNYVYISNIKQELSDVTKREK